MIVLSGILIFIGMGMPVGLLIAGFVSGPIASTEGARSFAGAAECIAFLTALSGLVLRVYAVGFDRFLHNN